MGNPNKKRAEQSWERAEGAFDRNEGDYSNLMGGYNDFIKTGGFSADDLSNIRARSIAPSRAIYANMNRELDRNRSLQGGYSPNYAAASAKMAREGSQAISDIGVNTEANIAEQTQRGKLAGLGGATNLYGTTPGQSALYGNLAMGFGQNKGGGWLDSLTGLAGSALPFLKMFPGGGKGNQPKDQIQSRTGATALAKAPVAGPSSNTGSYGGASGTDLPVSPGPIAPDAPIESRRGPGGPGDIPQDPTIPSVATSDPTNTVPVTNPNGEQVGAQLIAGTVPPIFMDNDYNIYDSEGKYLGNLMTGEGGGG